MFRDPKTSHKERDIKRIGIFHFSVNVCGVEYISGGNIACQGMSAVIDGKVIDRLVQTTEYKVMVTTEHFKLSTSVVTALSTREKLQCSPTS